MILTCQAHFEMMLIIEAGLLYTAWRESVTVVAFKSSKWKIRACSEYLETTQAERWHNSANFKYSNLLEETVPP